MPKKYALALYLILLSATVASIFSPFQTEALASLIRFAVASVLCVQFVFTAKPNMNLIRTWVWAFAIGSAVSVAEGNINSPEYSDRLNGLTTHSNTFGLVSLLAVILIFPLAPASRGIGRVLWGLILITSIIGTIQSGSRSALISLLAGMVVLTALSPQPVRAWRRFSFLVVAVLIPVLLWQLNVAGSAVQRLLDPTEFETQSNNGRIEHTNYVFERYAASPIFGAGMDIGVTAHNVYVQLLTAAGPLALVAFIGLIYSMLKPTLRIARSPTGTVLFSQVSRAVSGAVVAYAITALFSNNLWDRFVWLLLGLGMYIADQYSQGRMCEPTDTRTVQLNP